MTSLMAPENSNSSRSWRMMSFIVTVSTVSVLETAPAMLNRVELPCRTDFPLMVIDLMSICPVEEVLSKFSSSNELSSVELVIVHVSKTMEGVDCCLIPIRL